MAVNVMDELGLHPIKIFAINNEHTGIAGEGLIRRRGSPMGWLPVNVQRGRNHTRNLLY